MAKLTDIPVVTSLDDADLIYAVDVSDTTDDPAGSSVAITKANFGGGGGSSSFTGLELISEVENVTAGEFNFTSIPAGYDRLVLKGYVRSAAGGVLDGIRGWINGDTADANYWYQANEGANGTANGVEGALAVIAQCPAGGSIAGDNIQMTVIMEAPDDATKMNSYVATYGFRRSSGDAVSGTVFTSHNSDTAAITQFQITSDNHPTDLLTGKLQLFGEKALTVGGGGSGGGNSTPTVQSVKFNGADGSVAWNSESGWSSVREALGTYLITFPTAAPSLDEQALVGNTNLDASSAPCVVFFYDITTTTARAAVRRTDTDAALDYDFSVVRTLGASAPGGGLPAGTVVKEEIGRATDPAGDFIFSSLDFTGYDRLRIQGSFRSNTAVTAEFLNCYLNNVLVDTGYSCQPIAAQDASLVLTESTTARIGQCVGASAAAGFTTSIDLVIQNPAGGQQKIMRTDIDCPVLANSTVTGYWTTITPVTAAVTQINVRNASGNGNTGTLILYGERTL